VSRAAVPVIKISAAQVDEAWGEAIHKLSKRDLEKRRRDEEKKPTEEREPWPSIDWLGRIAKRLTFLAQSPPSPKAKVEIHAPRTLALSERIKKNVHALRRDLPELRKFYSDSAEVSAKLGQTNISANIATREDMSGHAVEFAEQRLQEMQAARSKEIEILDNLDSALRATLPLADLTPQPLVWHAVASEVDTLAGNAWGSMSGKLDQSEVDQFAPGTSNSPKISAKSTKFTLTKDGPRVRFVTNALQLIYPDNDQIQTNTVYAALNRSPYGKPKRRKVGKGNAEPVCGDT
jgi:hypothetical protein